MPAPTFTIILPTCERPRQLELCLKSLEGQTLSRSKYEVVVVDDGGMQEVVGRVVSNTTVACQVLAQDHRGAAAARNAGASVAKGRLLAFTDDDCRPAPDWLACLEQVAFNADGVVMVGGSVVNELKDDVFASAAQSLTDCLYAYFNHDPRRPRMLTSNNLCVPADAFASLGGFDTAFPGAGGEDREFCLRWSRAGYRSIYVPAATVYHAHDMTLSSFIRQQFAYGRGAAILRRLALEHGQDPIALEPLSFYWDLLRYPQRAPDIDGRSICSALFALSQLANGLGYFQVRLTQRTGGLRKVHSSLSSSASGCVR